MYSYEADQRPSLRTLKPKGDSKEDQHAGTSPLMSAMYVKSNPRDEGEVVPQTSYPSVPQASKMININQNLSEKECLNSDEADKSHTSSDNIYGQLHSRHSSKITVKKTSTFENNEYNEEDKLMYGFKYDIKSIASKFESRQEISEPSDVSPRKAKSSEDDQVGKERNTPTYGFKVIEKSTLYAKKNYWIIFLLILLISAMMHRFIKPEDTPVEEEISYQRAVKVFKAELKHIHKKYRNQEHGNWVKISTGLDAISNVSLSPHVLVLTGKSKDKTEDFAFNLHSAFSKAFGNKPCTPLNGIDYSNISERNNFFDNVSKCMEKHSVLIYDIDSVHGLNAMHLHAFADNENAPFKTSAIYLTLASECKDDVEKCVRSLISEKWKGHQTEDRILSLYSRILNMAVTVV